MKTVKTLLLGSAAGFVAVAGAQAADLPVKAKPVEYVKVCTLYGAGFYYVPGTDTCLKLGAYFRFQIESDASGGTTFMNGAAGLYTRTDTPNLITVFAAAFSWDTRTQTEYGTLRMYFRGGWEQTTPGTPDETSLLGSRLHPVRRLHGRTRGVVLRSVLVLTLQLRRHGPHQQQPDRRIPWHHAVRLYGAARQRVHGDASRSRTAATRRPVRPATTRARAATACSTLMVPLRAASATPSSALPTLRRR